MKTISALLTLVLIASSAYAQNSTTTTTPQAPAQDTSSGEATSITKVEPAPVKKASSPYILGFKSSIDGARQKNADAPGALIMSAKNELFAGYRDTSGWGAYLNGVQYYRMYNEQNATAKYKYNSTWSNSDASITFLHPDFYKSPEFSLYGQFRYYFRTTPRSRDKEIDSYAYYLRLNAQVAANQEIYNELIPRYQNSKNYAASDTTYYVEDMTIYNYKLNSAVKIGAKQWTQYEIHSATRPGFTMEAGPTATFTISPNLSISPSVLFPVAVSNSVEGANAYSVYGGPTAVNANQAYGNLYIQARF